MQNETDVKEKIREKLKARKIQHIAVTTGGYGSSGWQDICFLWRSVFTGIEAKWDGNTPTKLQRGKLDYVRDEGGIAHVVDENNIPDVDVILDGIVWANKRAAVSKNTLAEDVKTYCAEHGVQLWRD